MSGRQGWQAADTDDLDALLRRVGAGDRIAFEELYRRTSARLFGACLRILVDRGLAEEALQDAFLAIWRRARSFDAARGRPMTWLITVARNQSIDRLRATRPVADTPLDLIAETTPDPAAGAAESMAADEEARRLVDCLDRLDTAARDLIRTAFFQGSTYRELAARTATPLGTVKTRVRRALSLLRDCLA